jgi:hypothetical protein
MDNFNTILPSGDKLKELFAQPRITTVQIKAFVESLERKPKKDTK